MNETGAIKFTDLNDPNYKPEENGGVDFAEGMKVCCVRVYIFLYDYVNQALPARLDRRPSLTSIKSTPPFSNNSIGPP